MTEPARLYTPSEAAAVSGLRLKAVNNSIDKGLVEAVAKPAAGGNRAARRALTAEDLVRLRLEHGLSGKLPVEGRQRLFKELAVRPEAKHLSAGDFLLIDVAAARRQVKERLQGLVMAEKAIHRDRDVLGGEPVFKGTRIPVRSVVAMLDAGASEDDILSGYPKLNARLLDFARLWTAAHPPRGRPKRLDAHGFKLKSSRRTTLRSDPLPSAATPQARKA